tara:strand:- start:7540 stop:9606 length:2067 start_codon:yes stop_codon:yes gene_type:complete
MRKISKNTKAIKGNLSGLRNVFIGTFAGVGLKSLTNMADSMQLLEDRLVVFTGSTEEAADTLVLLGQAADFTNSSIDSLGTVYNRVALATQELGLSTKEMIGFTTTLQNTFRLSGATAAEAAGASIQLSQGLASGQLRGQELRSVLEANVVIGGILADQLNTTRGQLLKFAETGRLTSQVVLKALAAGAEDLAEQAQKLGQTFEQTLIKATNKLKIKLNELNKTFELNKKFASAATLVLENFETIIVALGSVAIPLLLGKLGGLVLSLGTLSKGNVFVALAAAVTTLGFALKELSKGDPLGKLTDDELRGELKGLNSNLENTIKNVERIENKTGTVGNKIGEYLFGSTTKTLEKSDKLIQTTIGRIFEVNAEIERRSKGNGKVGGALGAIIEFANGDFNIKTKGIAITLKELNKEFSKTGDAVAYAKALNFLKTSKLETVFAEGKKDLTEYNKEMRILKDELNEINGISFNPLERGAENALKKIQSTAKEVTGAVEGAFGTLEDQLFDFVKTGKFLFTDFAQSVLDDLTRIAIRQAVVAPLAGALFNSQAGSSGGAASSQDVGLGFAKGGAFSGGSVIPFASGGVVSSPTNFPMSGGRTGLMGESGPEAIIPLQRSQNGDLGVQSTPSKVVVNVTNNAGVDVDVQESSDGQTRTLDLTITKTVNNALKQGRFDKSLSTNFGVNRKGSK